MPITVDQALKSDDVVTTKKHPKALWDVPQRIHVDNSGEVISKALDQWAYENDVILDFSRAGNPMENCLIEAFNGALRDDSLNVHWIVSIDEAKKKIDAWHRDYNENRPHQTLKTRTPAVFALLARHLENTT